MPKNLVAPADILKVDFLRCLNFTCENLAQENLQEKLINVCIKRVTIYNKFRKLEKIMNFTVFANKSQLNFARRTTVRR